MDQYPSRRLGNYLWLGIALAAIGLILEIVVGLRLASATTELRVNASSQTAVISISQENTQATIIGTGTAHVRLKPGTYLLEANGSGMSATELVQVADKQPQTVSLNLAQPPKIPSVESISFVGLDNLIQHGLTSTQTTNLKQLIFNFADTAHNVSVIGDTVRSGPHDPLSNDPTFSILFSVTIDGKLYKATASYVDLTNVSLVLTDASSGAQIYSASSQ